MKKTSVELFRCNGPVRNTRELMVHPKWLPAIMLFAVLYIPFILNCGWKYRNIANIDLPSFYSAGVQVFRHGESPYDLERMQLLMGPDVRVFPYLYPPPSLLLFYPISLLDYATARYTVLAINHLLILALLWIIPFFLFRRSPSTSTALAFALTSAYLLTFHPIVVTLNRGQFNLLLLTLLLAFWLLARSAKPVSASLFLALAILLKTYPIILLPLLLVTGRRRESAYTIAWLGGLSAITALIVPSAGWYEWLTKVMPTGDYGRIPTGLFTPAGIWNQSLNGYFARAFTESKWSHPVLVDAGLARHLTYVTAGIVAAATGAAAWRSSRIRVTGLDRTIMVALPAMYLIAPFSWDHHLVYLLPSIILLLTARSKMPILRALLFYAASLGSAVIIAMPSMLRFKFYAVVVLWALSVFTACTGSIQLPINGMESNE